MIDLSEIKKLPDSEKVKIIDEILASMEKEIMQEDEVPDENYESALNHLLSERLAAYNRGGMKSYTWEEVEERLEKARQKLHDSKYE